MAVFDKILVPIDGSRPSDVGSALAFELAKQYGGTLFFVNIVDVGVLATSFDDPAMNAPEIADEAYAGGKRLVNEAIERARAQGITADGTVLTGPVLERLLHTCDAEKTTAVVMGSHGRGPLAQLLMGSTSDVLVRRSKVPVLIAPRGTPTTPP